MNGWPHCAARWMRQASAVAAPIRFETLAEDALLLHFGERIEPALNDRVHAAVAALRRELPQVECVPAYASMLLRFDPLAWRDQDASDPQRGLRQAVCTALDAEEAPGPINREQEIPVCYGGSYGPDLASVALHLGMPADEVVARHVGGIYRVAMLGFAPGFPYLLGLDPLLAMPRRSDPRQRVPAGSVAIGGEQTGIYPDELPGGWQLIGRTPLHLFDVGTTPPSLLAAGDRVRFRAIAADEFQRIDAEQRR
ncbi:MAG TPA: 5-oxoprolinase subunit PxpB [Rhodanobacter sp.]|nr:5-oxoprolinase subunit PxpB [Rhodanobacter sp.]